GPMEEVGCLRCSVAPYPLSPHFPFPPYEIPLRVIIALASFLGFGMVLLGKELELEGWLVLPKSSNLVQRLVNKLVTFAI
ncbi:hypothetical protein Tco_0337918, partial [Tanacetum coccineum]